MPARPIPRGCCAHAIALLVLAPLSARAQVDQADPVPPPEISRPAAARRLVQEFTFDDPEPFAIPRHWDLAQDGSKLTGPRPGYPRWNTAELDASSAARGRGSVRLATAGGSVCLRLDPGVVPVFPDAEYLVSARVMTRGLRDARAAVTARYLDKTNQPIAASVRRSDLAASADWSTLSVPLPAGFQNAAYIQIDLELLQPQEYRRPDLGRHQVWPQDYSGSAWFDDVAVVQLPRVSISTGSPGNIVERPAAPTVNIVVRDLTGEALSGELTLQDARGVTVDHAERPLESGLSRWEWKPAITQLGWYRATLELRTRERRVGATHVDFVWVEPAGGVRGATAPDQAGARFSIILSSLPPAQRAILPDLIRLSGASGVSIPVWSEDLTADQVAALAQDLVPTVDRLKSDWRRVTFCLPSIPAELSSAARIEPDRPLALFGTDPKVWAPYLDPLLDKFGQGVQRWQVGQTESATEPAALGAPLDALRKALSRLVPGPVIALPWPAELAPPSGFASNPSLEALATIPYGTPVEGVGGLAQPWAALRSESERGAPATLLLAPLPPDQFSRHDAAAELVKSAVALWAATGAPQGVSGTPAASGGGRPIGLALPQPWEWPARADGAPMPRAELAAFRSLADRLRFRRIAGMLSAPGATCYILAPASDAPPGLSGALVAWQSRAAADPVVLDAFLGRGPVSAVDLFGNAHTVEPVGPTDSAATGPGQRTHRIPLTGDPLFIEGVDVELALFASSFALDPSRLPPTTAEHDLAIILTNPWPTSIEGRLSILEPGGLSNPDPSKRDRSWQISPRVGPFRIGPGQTVRLPLSVTFSAVEEAGVKDFVAQIDLSGTQDCGPLRLRTSLEVGLESSPLDLSYQVSGDDVILEAQVTNRSSTPATLELAAHAPGYPRLKASVSELPPGASASRRFSLPAAMKRVRGERVTVSMQDLESRARITRTITIE